MFYVYFDIIQLSTHTVCEFCFETKTLEREKVPQKSYIYYVSSSLTKKLKCGKKEKKEEDQLALHTKNISLNNSAKVYVGI